jgi:predicted DNA repair protein MutK
VSGGLAALLDDIATMAKLAAASVDDVGAAAGRASTKAAGVVVDDTAVTPRYVQGIEPKRELPIIRRIAVGSLRNKLVFILPAALLLSEFLPWLLTPLLMIGGTYLAYEGAEKIWEKLSGHHEEEEPAAITGGDHEKEVTRGAIRTDFILSAEIMVIALNEVASEGFVSRAAILVAVAILITILVYGVVGLIVKLDDIGVHLAERESEGVQRLGRGMVKAMPKLLAVLSTVGIAAMLWVGGHILLNGTHDLAETLHADWLGALYDFVHHLEEDLHHAVEGLGGLLGWLVNTAFSAAIGVVVGAIVVAVMHVLPRRKGAESR